MERASIDARGTKQRNKGTKTRSRENGGALLAVIEVDSSPLLEVREADGLRELPEPQREQIVEGVVEYGETLAEGLGDASTNPALLKTVAAAGTTTVKALVSAADQRRELLTSLPRTRLAPVTRAVERVTELLTSAAYREDITTRQLEEQAKVAVNTFTVLLNGRPRQLQSVIDALEPVVDDPGELEEVEAEELVGRGQIAMHALYRKLVVESYSVADLREWGLSRQRLKQMRDESLVFAVRVPYQRSLLYPQWQFDLTNRPRREMRELITTAQEAGLDAIGFHQIMTNPRAGGDVPPARMLDEGKLDLVLDILRAADR